jgi:dsRNA-specific ribonuclease
MLDQRKTKLDNGYLSKVASRFDLMSCTDWPWVVTPKRLATLVEAIIGAVYLDSEGDMRAVKRVMLALGFVEVLDEPDHSIQQQIVVQGPTAEICDMMTLHNLSDSEEDDLESDPASQA